MCENLDMSEMRGSEEFAMIGEILDWIAVAWFSICKKLISSTLNDAAGTAVVIASSGMDFNLLYPNCEISKV